jgi:hypothetical protein
MPSGCDPGSVQLPAPHPLPPAQDRPSNSPPPSLPPRANAQSRFSRLTLPVYVLDDLHARTGPSFTASATTRSFGSAPASTPPASKRRRPHAQGDPERGARTRRDAPWSRRDAPWSRRDAPWSRRDAPWSRRHPPATLQGDRQLRRGAGKRGVDAGKRARVRPHDGTPRAVRCWVNRESERWVRSQP